MFSGIIYINAYNPEYAENGYHNYPIRKRIFHACDNMIEKVQRKRTNWKT
jgi:hypothetical protein